MTKLSIDILILGLSFGICLEGQISQDHPALCGNEMRATPVPAGVSASIDRANGVATLTLQASGPSITIPLSGVQDEIREVCATPQGRLIVFGWNGAYNINIVDKTSGALVDSFFAYDAVLSPDQSWLAMRKFYSFHTEVAISEQYLLYDLQGTRKAVSIIYPVMPKDGSTNTADVPDSDTHRAASDSFYWAKDSRAVVFADIWRGALSVVLVTLTEGETATFVHPVLAGVVCAQEASAGPGNTKLNHAEVTSTGMGLPAVVAELQSDRPGCESKQLNLTSDDFRRAALERYQVKQRKQSTGTPKQ